MAAPILLSLRVVHRPGGRPALDETVRCPVGLQPTDKFRGQGRDPFYPLLVPPRYGPRLFAGEAFKIVAVTNRGERFVLSLYSAASRASTP